MKLRSILGIIAGALFLISSSAHMLLGWAGISERLRESHVPADLLEGLHVGWQFGGTAMIAFGCIVIATFVRRMRGERVSLLIPGVIAAAYVLFGTWALVISRGEPFFAIAFVLPGLLLAVASIPTRAAS